MSLKSNMEGLRQRVAIVTGATSGLGWATSLALAGEGVRVVATGRRNNRLVKLKEEVERAGGECIGIPGDASDPQTAAAVVSEAMSQYGRLDILVNNAGQGSYKSLLETTPEDYDLLMDSNVRSTFLFTRAVAAHFIEQRSGVMIFVSSVAGLVGASNEALYSATKFAQVGFAQSVDEELRCYGIKICVVCPGGMKTEFAVGRGRIAEEVASSWMMDPPDVADTIVFACKQPSNVRLPQLIVRHMGKPS